MDGRDSGRSVGRGEFLSKLAERSIAEFLDDHCPQLAAGIAYHVLFSIFPLAIVLAGIFGIVVHLTGAQADVVDAIVRNVPLSPSGDARLRQLLRGATGGLSAFGLLGIVGLIYAAGGMMAAIRLALNEAWDIVEYRPFLRGKLIDVGLVFAVAMLVLASLGLTIGVRTVGGAAAHVGIDFSSGWASWLLGVARPPEVGPVAASGFALNIEVRENRLSSSGRPREKPEDPGPVSVTFEPRGLEASGFSRGLAPGGVAADESERCPVTSQATA